MPKIIRQKRKQMGLSQAQLARLMGCSQGQISFIERDINGSSPDLAEKIATFPDIPLSEVITADRTPLENNRETFRKNREARAVRQQLKNIGIRRHPYQTVQRRLIFRFGKLIKVFDE